MRIERADAIVALQLRAEGLVALQDVEHVAQHFQHHAIGLRPHRGRARVIAHAGHLAEEVAGSQFGDGVVVGQIDRGINRDERPVGFFAAAVLLARRQHAFEPAEKSAAAALRLDVRNRAGKKDFRFAFQNIKSCGTEISFAADDLAGAETSLDHRFLVEFEKCAGDVFKNRQMQKLGRVKNVTFSQLAFRPPACW